MDHPHLRVRGPGGELLGVEAAVGRTAAEVTGAAAPRLSASTAWADSEPKLLAETLTSAMSYGWVQCGPPTRTRGGTVATGTATVLWSRCSYPTW